VQIHAEYILTAIILIVIAMGVSAIKWQLILNGQELYISWLELYRAYWIGLFFNNFLPSSMGGDAIRILHIGMRTGNKAAVASSVVIERLIATLALALVGFCASFFVSVKAGYIQVAFGAIVVITVLLTGLLIWGKAPSGLICGSMKVTELVQGFLVAGEKLRYRPRLLLYCLIWSVLFQCINVGVNYSLFRGLGLAHIGLWEALFIVPATSALAMIPLGINGYGLREGGYVTLLADYGVGNSGALTASILFAFLVSGCSLWGGLLWLKTAKGALETDDDTIECT